MARVRPESVDPHLSTDLKITTKTRVASAGSCFAQHISNSLIERGYNYYSTELAPAWLSPELARRYNYGIFSARYGNIYTPLQLLQLVLRASGEFVPQDQMWADDNGRHFDLLRPRIMPQGFSSRAEAEADNQQHLAAVRKLFQTTDVFVFTLGLTECWRSRVDGTVYPTCPGCGSAGEYHPSNYEFHNFTVAETVDHLGQCIERLSAANPSLRFILTVSPVPLMATMEPRHVLQATTYSKSVLRVCAEEMVRRFANVEYFASYELITATRNAPLFFASDGRTVTKEGVERVMDCFFARFGDPEAQAPSPASPAIGEASPRLPQGAVLCDEEDFFRALANLKQ